MCRGGRYHRGTCLGCTYFGSAGSRKSGCGHCGPAMLRTWSDRQKERYQIPDDAGAGGGYCCAAAGDPFRGMAVCKAGRYSDVQHLHADKSGKSG